MPSDRDSTALAVADILHCWRFEKQCVDEGEDGGVCADA